MLLLWNVVTDISNLKICIKEIICCTEEFYELNFTEVGVTRGVSKGITMYQHSTRTNNSLISLEFSENAKKLGWCPSGGQRPL